MDDIIQKIMDIEKQAKEIVDEARNEKRAFEQNMRTEIDAYRESADTENKEKIRVFGLRMKDEAEDGVRRIEETTRQKITEMREASEARRNEWAEYFYEKIIKGEI